MSGEVAAYIRVSSDKQDTARQEEAVRSAARRHFDCGIDHWFKDAEGRNPRDLPHKRRDFQRMMAAVEAGRLSCIIVDSQDRFGTRDAHQFGAFITKLRDNNCSLFDANGRDLSGDDDATVLTGTIGALTSSREQREKARRCIGGMLEHAKQGKYVGGYPPFGLDVVCFGPDGKEKWRSVYVGHFDRQKVYPDGTCERFQGKDNSPQKDNADTFYVRPSVETERLEIVRQIFKWYATETISPRQIATRLRDLKIDPVYGKPWDKVRISSMLRNPVYIGRPTWNKRGGSRFVEFVRGQIRDIQRIGNVKTGRHREAADMIALDRPQFEAIVDRKTWEAVQAKIERMAQGRGKKSAQTAELWLRPFLVCGHCMKPMHATRGVDRLRTWPSYFCATYGQYGPENPTGCHCHRVKHDKIEGLLSDYVSNVKPQIKQLLSAVRSGDRKLLDAVAAECGISRAEFSEASRQALEFFDAHATADEKRRRRGGDFFVLLGQVFQRVRPTIEKQIAGKESELDRMLDDFRGLAPILRDRANAKMETIQTEIELLRAQLAGFSSQYKGAEAELAARMKAVDRAEDSLRNPASGRQKTAIVSDVIDKIICYFEHSETRPRKRNQKRKNHGKSLLTKVEFHPVEGDVFTCFTDGKAEAQD
jgi:DNA invertase Pin-like site-specific DNA recombinase